MKACEEQVTEAGIRSVAADIIFDALKLAVGGSDTPNATDLGAEKLAALPQGCHTETSEAPAWTLRPAFFVAANQRRLRHCSGMPAAFLREKVLFNR